MILSGDSLPLVRARARAEHCEESLAEFMKEAWPWAREPDQYLTNWHIDCMCDYLTAAIDWQLGNLLMFCLPPGHSKSLGINVFFLPWLWAQEADGKPLRPNSWRGPGARMISMGYNQDLIYTHAGKALSLIRSGWYQNRWGDRFELEKQGVEEFNNNKGGLRRSMSSKGGVTGFGAHIISLDDVHNRAANSYEADRIKMIDTYDNALQSRVRDVRGLFLLCMQRTSENDIIGHILANKYNGVLVCLPYEFEKKHPYVFLRDLNPEQLKRCGALLEKPVIRKTYSSDRDIGPNLGEVWEDKRSEGDALWPEKWPKDFIAQQTKTMTSHDKAGQYQQRPTAAAGGMFKREWFQAKQPISDRFAFIQDKGLKCVRAWDLAWTEPEPGKEPDYTCGVLFGYNQKSTVGYVLDVFRARLSPAQLEEAVLQMAAIDGELCRVRIPQDPGAGKFVAYQLQKKLIGYDVIVEPEHAPKVQRAAPFAGACENRFVVLAESSGPDGWNEAFINELCAFPNGKNDDQVDAACAAFRACVRVPVWTTLAA